MKWVFFFSLTCTFYLVLLMVTAERRALGTRIREFVIDEPRSGQRRANSSITLGKWIRKLLLVAGERLRPSAQASYWNGVQAKLDQSGNPLGLRAMEWVGLRICLMLTGLCMGILLAFLEHGFRAWMIALVLAGFGWIGPDFWLSRRVTERQYQISRELPNALDLLTVSVEAGLGFDQALVSVAQKSKGPLSSEFARTIREIQLGSVRTVALQRMATRTGVDEVHSFVSAIVQADKLGTGLAHVLRIQSASIRERHRLNAQERAMKAPTKMLFPLVMFVFPSMFIIILGPALLHMVHTFSRGGL